MDTRCIGPGSYGQDARQAALAVVPAGLQGGPVHRGLWAPLSGPHPKILGLELWPPPMLQAEGGSAPTLRTKQARTQPLIKRV